jgi:hypothetical protein
MNNAASPVVAGAAAKSTLSTSDLLRDRSCTARGSPTVTRRNFPSADDSFRR